MTAESTSIVMQDGDGWRLYRQPVRVISAGRPADVVPALKEVETAAESGWHAAGFITYEAAPGLDRAFETAAPGYLPPAWFALFKSFEPFRRLEDALAKVGPPSPGAAFTLGSWEPSLSRVEYDQALERIRAYLKEGDTYQVNFTLRLRSSFAGDPRALFRRIHANQEGRFSMFVETGAFALCSASPELFFELDGDRLTSRPMKGTSRRGLTYEEDRGLAEQLERSEKNRAENVMIVDMVRNDMGRVAEPGSVGVERLYEVERYPTVLQMTSTVACRTSAGFADIVRALFPCASITGAPKVRTMQIIRELEKAPRGIYTGCMGCVEPGGRRARFNVAIRTVSVDKANGAAEYGVGGGIVWDSIPAGEYEECRIKAAVLTAARAEFRLLETLLWQEDSGCFLLEEHLERMMHSAEYFGFAWDGTAIRKRLEETVRGLGPGAFKVRLLAGADGSVAVEAGRLPAEGEARPWQVKLADRPVDANDPFLYHKTTNRSVYEQAKRGGADCDDVILWNERGEITESTVANVVVERAGRRVTPPVSCGLLAGVYRGHLLKRGEIEEGIVTVGELKRASKVFLINSVRKWIPAVVT